MGRQTGGGFAIAGLITGYLGTLIIGIAFIAGLTAPLVVRQRKKADQTEAVSNARSFGLALYDFQDEFGRFPDASTARLVADETGTAEITGSSSNARFRQLIRAGISGTENSFYAKAAGTRKPDGIISGDQAIAPGECGFGYVENIRTDDNIPRPLAMAPFVRGTDIFDPMPFDHKAVILWSDMSVRTLPIDRITSEVILDGQNILDPAHPVWGGVPPSLLLPE
jgi:type II secretory pathway pseudopilin PulG